MSLTLKKKYIVDYNKKIGTCMILLHALDKKNVVSAGYTYAAKISRLLRYM